MVSSFNYAGTETKIFRENQANTTATDAFPPCVTMSSTAMVLAMQDNRIIVFHNDGF